MSNERDYWPARVGYRVSVKAKEEGIPALQTEDERDKRIEKCYQEYMEVQKGLLEENPTDYDTPAKLKRNSPLTKENFISMNGGKLEWGIAVTDVVKRFIQRDLLSFANEVYGEVVKSDWFKRSIKKLTRDSPELNRKPWRRHGVIAMDKYKHLINRILDRQIYKFCGHMSSEDKKTVKELVWINVAYVDYVKEYLNRKEHPHMIDFGIGIKQTVVEDTNYKSKELKNTGILNGSGVVVYKGERVDDLRVKGYKE